MVPPAKMMKELGRDYLNYDRLAQQVKLHYKSKYVIKHSLKNYLENTKYIVDDEFRNEDVVIYLTGALPYGEGIYTTTFIINYNNLVSFSY